MSNDLAAAIIAARANPANAQYFATHASNYLIGELNKGHISGSDLQTIAATGTL